MPFLMLNTGPRLAPYEQDLMACSSVLAHTALISCGSLPQGDGALRLPGLPLDVGSEALNAAEAAVSAMAASTAGEDTVRSMSKQGFAQRQAGNGL